VALRRRNDNAVNIVKVLNSNTVRIPKTTVIAQRDSRRADRESKKETGELDAYFKSYIVAGVSGRTEQEHQSRGGKRAHGGATRAKGIA